MLLPPRCLQRWITFQLLHGLSQAHAHGVCHGDIKCENVMVTSWNWLFLTDFASYKPTYLPADNPVSGTCRPRLLLAAAEREGRVGEAAGLVSLGFGWN